MLPTWKISTHTGVCVNTLGWIDELLVLWREREDVRVCEGGRVTLLCGGRVWWTVGRADRPLPHSAVSQRVGSATSHLRCVCAPLIVSHIMQGEGREHKRE
jgi:hypothetical protein